MGSKVTYHNGPTTWTKDLPTFTATAGGVRFEEPPINDKDIPKYGSITEMLEWVGDSTGRAMVVRDKENQRPHPRASLISQLNEIIGE